MEFDGQKAVLRNTQTDASASHVSHTRDPRSSSDMVPDEVWAPLPPDSDIEDSRGEGVHSKGSQFRVRDPSYEKNVTHLTTTISSKKARRKEMVKERYRLFYSDIHPSWELQRQAIGEVPGEDDKLGEASSSPTAPTLPGFSAINPTA